MGISCLYTVKAVPTGSFMPYDDEIPTLEEYYDYDSTQGSAYAQLFELVRNKLEKA